jgi:hypothetical protein
MDYTFRSSISAKNLRLIGKMFAVRWDWDGGGRDLRPEVLVATNRITVPVSPKPG